MSPTDQRDADVAVQLPRSPISDARSTPGRGPRTGDRQIDRGRVGRPSGNTRCVVDRRQGRKHGLRQQRRGARGCVHSGDVGPRRGDGLKRRHLVDTGRPVGARRLSRARRIVDSNGKRQRNQCEAGQKSQQPPTIPVTGKDAIDDGHHPNVPSQRDRRSARDERHFVPVPTSPSLPSRLFLPRLPSDASILAFSGAN